ncbi:type I pullulanase [Clostridium sp. D46t1_190503_E9]|uniref:type I pullulanase n=1 Tax=Clostridium sp. D46t1_190503_E9 TaxID=2787137 RepID=UPI001898FC0A|nr:type I pullulanase [Clostridium sp. D46t1_190503_E9]
MYFNYKNYDSIEFEDLYRYDGELGAIYSSTKTKFRLWAPLAANVKINLYGKDGYDYESKANKTVNMDLREKGIWEIEISGNLDGEFYNYLVNIDGKEYEAVDPYAKAVGVNGKRGMIIDLNKTNPDGWESHKKPVLENSLDAVIYEMNVRDFTIDSNSGIDNEIRGKFKGICQDNSAIKGTEIKTGLSHLKELGVNVIQLLPSFDYKTVDERRFNENEYNWGYDPLNYNVPEGSYSTNPYLGEVRIKEFKELIMKLHESGFKVVMDVVYNHTADTENSNFNSIVPKYYYRQNNDGGFSNGSGCGNEIASERIMVRKFIVDSLKYWVNEYKIDGFRFDLMGLHDIETMKVIREELNKIDRGILIYGEGWKASDSPLSNERLSLKNNIRKFGNLQIGAFSDDIRDAIKGDVFEKEKGGFINGGIDFEESLKFGIVASVKHKDIDYDRVIYSNDYWANEPYQVITYTSAHDNYTLWDKLSLAKPLSTKKERIAMNKMAAAIVLTSQGIPFIHSGDEILRTKVDANGHLIENSYKSPDSVNKFDWSRKEIYIDIFEYYKSLIQLRKDHKVFKMNSSKEIEESIQFLKMGENFTEKNIVGYIADGNKVGDSIGKIVIIFNSNKYPVEVKLNHNKLRVIVDKNNINEDGLYNIEGNKVKVEPISTMIMKYI